MNHHLTGLLLGGALHLAELPDKLSRVLDLGTGTGIWAIDMAEYVTDRRMHELKGLTVRQYASRSNGDWSGPQPNPTEVVSIFRPYVGCQLSCHLIPLRPRSIRSMSGMAETNRLMNRVPPNCTFEVDDLDKPWLWTQPFDFIHSANISQGISDFPTYAKRIYEYVQQFLPIPGMLPLPRKNLLTS